MHRTGDAPHGALDLRMAGMADQDDVVIPLGIALAFLVYLADQGTGGVYDLQAALVGVMLDLLGDAMGAENRDRAFRDLVHLFDETRTARLQAFDDPFVVDDLVAHVDRRPVQGQRPFHDIDCAFHASTEATRLGQQHAQRSLRHCSGSFAFRAC